MLSRMAEITVNLSPQVVNYVGIPYGDDFSSTLNVTETIAGVPTPFDWTGATVSAHIVASLKSKDEPSLLSMTDAQGAGGALTISATKLQLAVLGVGSWYHNIEITKGGMTRTYFCGVFQIVVRGPHA